MNACLRVYVSSEDAAKELRTCASSLQGNHGLMLLTHPVAEWLSEIEQVEFSNIDLRVGAQRVHLPATLYLYM